MALTGIVELPIKPKPFAESKSTIPEPVQSLVTNNEDGAARARRMVEEAREQHKKESTAQMYTDPHKNPINKKDKSASSYSNTSRSSSDERETHYFRNLILIPTALLLFGGYGYCVYANNFDIQKTNYSINKKASEMYRVARNSDLIVKVFGR